MRGALHRGGRPQGLPPNQIWVEDITCIATQEDWLYLAAILDLYSRKISRLREGR